MMMTVRTSQATRRHTTPTAAAIAHAAASVAGHAGTQTVVVVVSTV